jgi:hypothetical protein
LRQKYSELAAGRIGSFLQQYQILHADGTYRWLEGNFVAAFNRPLINGVVCDCRDITERKLAEDRVAQRDEVLRLASDAVHGIVFEWDLGLGVVHRSRGVYDVLGLEPKELEAEGAWSARIHPQDSREYEDMVPTVFAIAGAGIGPSWSAAWFSAMPAAIRCGPSAAAWMCRRSSGSPICWRRRSGRRKMGGWEYSYVTHELSGRMRCTASTRRARRNSCVLGIPCWRDVCRSRRAFQRGARAVGGDGTGRSIWNSRFTTLKEQRMWVRLIGHVRNWRGGRSAPSARCRTCRRKKLAQIALENSTGWLKLSMNMAHMHAWRWDRATDSLEFALDDGRQVHLPSVFPGIKKLMRGCTRRIGGGDAAPSMMPSSIIWRCSGSSVEDSRRPLSVVRRHREALVR